MSVKRISASQAEALIGDTKLILASDYDELHERVAWMMECATGYNPNGWAFWLGIDASDELCDSCNAAWEAVEELL